MSAASDPRLAELIYKYANTLSIREDGRVRCDLNGHVFPAAGAFEAVSKFVEGPKYRKLAAREKDHPKLAKLEPFLVPSKHFPGRLWCALTQQLLAADLQTAKRHMAGRKFLNAQQRFKDDEQFLYEEPSLSAGESEDGQDEGEEVEAPSPAKKGKAKGEREEAEPSVLAEKGKGSKGKGKTGERKPFQHRGNRTSEERAKVEEESEFWVPEWAEEAECNSEGAEEAEENKKAEGKGTKPVPQLQKETGQNHETVGDKEASGKHRKRRNPNRRPAKRMKAV